MQINGSKIVLEEDGTVVDEDDVFRALSCSTFMLLQSHETWEPPLPDTDTAGSSSFSSISSNIHIPGTSTPVNSSLETFFQEDTARNTNTAFENKWSSFKIPWDKMLSATLKDCQNGDRNPRTTTNVIQVVADAMRDICTSPPNKAIRQVARQIVNKFPQTFQDTDDDGTVMGDDGAIVVFSRLKERLKYLNRSTKRRSVETEVIPLKQRKKLLAAKAGCINWQPSVCNAFDDGSRQENLKRVDMHNETEETVHLLEETYPLQRKFLNAPQPPTILQIQSEWPILLSKIGIKWHFEKLMGLKINDMGLNLINKYEKVGKRLNAISFYLSFF